MKKIGLIIVLMLGLTACGNKDIEGNIFHNDEIINNFSNEEEVINKPNNEENSITEKVNKEEIIDEVEENAPQQKIEENIIKEDKENEVGSIEDTPKLEVETVIEEKIHEDGIEVGKSAIDFEVELLSGEKVKLSNYLGKPVFLNFWATWCGPCVGEMPAIENIKNEYDGKLEVLLINGGESRDDVEFFINKKGYSFNVGLDKNGEILTTYDSMYIPLSIFIDENGVIQERKVGALSYNDMKNIVKNLVNME